MTATRTRGITIAADGRFFIDNRYRGIRIGMRVGTVGQVQAEARLRTEMSRIDRGAGQPASLPRSSTG